MGVRKYEWTQVNFTAGERLTIESMDYTGNEKAVRLGRLVSVYQSVASMRFQFDMTPDQAREMAMALIAAAEALA